MAKLLGDEELYNSLRTHAGSADKYKEYSKIYRQWFLDKGYNLISYMLLLENDKTQIVEEKNKLGENFIDELGENSSLIEIMYD